MILINPFFEVIPSIDIASSLPLKSSLIDIFKFNSPNEIKVSPSKGALFIMTNFSNVTFAFGKFLNKLKSASAKETLASTLALMASEILAFI